MPLEGVLVPIVTPFRPGTLEIDLDFVSTHLRFLERAGVDGVLVCGTTGEFPLLSLSERRRVIGHVLEERGGLAVLVGAGATSVDETRSLVRLAGERGGDGVLVVPSYYYKEVTPAGLEAYYGAVLEGSPLPAYLYHVPRVSGVPVPPTLAGALRESLGVAGVKDSSGSRESLEGFCAVGGLAVFVGNDRLVLEGLRLGARGAITAVANVFPRRVLDVVRAFRRGGDAAGAQSRLARIRGVFSAAGAAPAVAKALLELQGFPASAVRPPLAGVAPGARRRLRMLLEKDREGGPGSRDP